jgi:hypothetical protein
MVNIHSVRQSNSQITASSPPRTAVFVSGTVGIGKLALTQLINLGTNIKAYIIGRKRSKAAFSILGNELQQANPNAQIVWIEGEVSLLSEVHRICSHIKALEKSVDLLFLTTRYAPFGGRQSTSYHSLPTPSSPVLKTYTHQQDTSEGLDISHALEYYSRICFVENLLLQLRASVNARVISVLSGGMERDRLLGVEDLNLERPGAFGGLATQCHMGIMGTLTMEQIAEEKENAGIVFIYSHSGIVRTGNLFRGWQEGLWGHG